MKFFTFFLITFLVIYVIECKKKNRICVSGNNKRNEKDCKIISNSPDSQVQCVYDVDRMGCLQQIMNDKAEFGVFQAEELLLLSSNNASNNLMVTNELRFVNQTYEYDMVVIVSNNANINSLSDLRGQSFCHPGFDEAGYMADWSETFSQYFESKVVPLVCDPTLSVTENQIKSLSSFFGNSCKPGWWAPDADVDSKMKSKYQSLCDQCDDPQQCSIDDKYWGRTRSLYCLTDCRGNVTWARLGDAKLHFEGGSLVCDDVSFLCPDGTKQPISTNDPCVWISKPWPIVVSSKASAKNTVTLMEQVNKALLNSSNYKSWQLPFRSLLDLKNPSYYPVTEIEPLPAIEYLRKVPGLIDTTSFPKCSEVGDNRDISVCVENDVALEKCNHMATVAKAFSINPNFICGLSSNCYEDVVNNKYDILTTDTDQLINMRKDHKLRTILYQTNNDFDQLRHSSIVVRNDSDIWKLKDLKSKKACFSKVDGVGWNSLILSLKEHSLLPNICPYSAALSDFFNDSCVVEGFSDYIRPCLPSGFLDISSDPTTNKQSRAEVEALKCVAEGGGDVAFIDYNFIPQYLSGDQWGRNLQQQDFRAICPHNDKDGPNNCYLTWSSFGQVMVNDGMTKSREEQVVMAFTLLNLFFGEPNLSPKSKSIQGTFRLFASFNNADNDLFQSLAGQLEKPSSLFGRIKKKYNYETNLKTMGKCAMEIVPSGNSSPLLSSWISLIFVVAIFINVFILG